MFFEMDILVLEVHSLLNRMDSGSKLLQFICSFSSGYSVTHVISQSVIMSVNSSLLISGFTKIIMQQSFCQFFPAFPLNVIPMLLVSDMWKYFGRGEVRI